MVDRVSLSEWKRRYLDGVHLLVDVELTPQERDALRDMLQSSAAKKVLARLMLTGIARKEELLGLNPMVSEDAAKLLRTQGAFAERYVLIDEVLSMIGVSDG